MGEKREEEVMKWSSPHAGELTASSKTGSVLLKWKWLPFAPVWLAISRTRKEFWCRLLSQNLTQRTGAFCLHGDLLLEAREMT